MPGPKGDRGEVGPAGPPGVPRPPLITPPPPDISQLRGVKGNFQVLGSFQFIIKCVECVVK